MTNQRAVGAGLNFCYVGDAGHSCEPEPSAKLERQCPVGAVQVGFSADTVG